MPTLHFRVSIKWKLESIRSLATASEPESLSNKSPIQSLTTISTYVDVHSRRKLRFPDFITVCIINSASISTKQKQSFYQLQENSAENNLFILIELDRLWEWNFVSLIHLIGLIFLLDFGLLSSIFMNHLKQFS